MNFPWTHALPCGDMTALWLVEENTVEFALLPADAVDNLPTHRDSTAETACRRDPHRIFRGDTSARVPFNAIQFKIMGDSNAGGYAAGASMLASESLRHLGAPVLEELPDGIRLIQRDAGRGLVVRQDVRYQPGERFVRVSTTLSNEGTAPVVLESLPSFNLGFLSPFQEDDGPGAYRIVRWRSNWSNEGRPDEDCVEDIGLERSWGGGAARVVRFGNQGSMPVRGYFPQVAFEDTRASVVWGAVIDAKGSWQAEVVRWRDFLGLSGGYVDREFGQWTKTLSPGESYTAPEAALSVAHGDVQTLQNRLVEYGQGEVRAPEQDLPVLFNDWCTFWGKCSAERDRPLARRLQAQGLPIRYYVTDAGWFKSETWWEIGDWAVDGAKYPDGMRAFAEELRGMGLIPGIWFEWECVTPGTLVHTAHPDWVLHLDGHPLQSGSRRFLDLRKPEVRDYLAEAVIDFLRENKIGYVKVDYNDTTGFGCDGAPGESPSEALRQHVEATYAFFQRILRELPDLVLEICSSGGHRLSAPWMRLCSMASFSDAHEGLEIPLVAANTAHLIPMRKNQIWAVLHADDGEDRFFYLLAGGFLGRLCLSGDIAALSDEQMRWVAAACALYHEAAPAIRDGETRVTRNIGPAYLEPCGHQVFERVGRDGTHLVVVHTFHDAPARLDIPLTGGVAPATQRAFCPTGVGSECDGAILRLRGVRPLQGMVFVFRAD